MKRKREEKQTSNKKKTFSIFVLSDKTRERNSPAFTKKNHTHRSKSTTFSPTHEKQKQNTKFVRY